MFHLGLGDQFVFFFFGEWFIHCNVLCGCGTAKKLWKQSQPAQGRVQPVLSGWSSQAGSRLGPGLSQTHGVVSAESLIFLTDQ